MKKNLLAVCAFVLAVGLSAFTNRHQTTSAKFTDPYWYSYNSTNNTLTGFIAQESQDDLMLNTDCKDQVLPVCAKGYSSSQGSSFPITAPAGAIDVKKRNP
jgi:hypothetical protein